MVNVVFQLNDDEIDVKVFPRGTTNKCKHFPFLSLALCSYLLSKWVYIGKRIMIIPPASRSGADSNIKS